jgi:hypothetical protein
MAAATASITAIMTSLAKNVPMHTWLAALPQLISRMCHPCKEVSELAKQIIVRITQASRQKERPAARKSSCHACLLCLSCDSIRSQQPTHSQQPGSSAPTPCAWSNRGQNKN